MEGPRQRHPSGGVSAKEMVIGLEGVELGADGKVRVLSLVGGGGGGDANLHTCSQKQLEWLDFTPGFELVTNCLQTVSYTQFLYPTNVLGGRRNTIDSTSSFAQSRNASHRSLSLGRANSNQSSLDTGQWAADGRPGVTASTPSSPSAVAAVALQGTSWGTFATTTPTCWTTRSGLAENTRGSSFSPPTW